MNKKFIIGGIALAVVGFILWNLNIISIPIVSSQPTIEWKPDNSLYSDYPINLQIENILANNTLKITHQVTFDNKENKYRYYYRVQNLGKDPILFNWEVFDKEKPAFMEIAATEVYEHSINSPKPPILSKSQALVLKKIDKIWVLADKVVSLGPVPND